MGIGSCAVIPTANAGRSNDWGNSILDRGRAGGSVRASSGERGGRRFRRHEPSYRRGALVDEQRQRLRHGGMAGVARLANLVAVGAVPVRRHVQAQRKHRQDQHDRDERSPPLAHGFQEHQPYPSLALQPLATQFRKGRDKIANQGALAFSVLPENSARRYYNCTFGQLPFDPLALLWSIRDDERNSKTRSKPGAANGSSAAALQPRFIARGFCIARLQLSFSRWFCGAGVQSGSLSPCELFARSYPLTTGRIYPELSFE